MPRVAYRAIRSRRRFMKHAEAIQGLADAMEREIKPHLIEEHNKVVANWNHKPTFQARKYIQPDSLRVTVHATGHNKQIWNWVNEGTAGKGEGRTYTIPAKRAPMLAFQLGYVPKTSPGGGYGGAGVATGPWVRAHSVQHPGIKPREFPIHIAEKNRSWYSRTMENIWRRVIRSL
jgi:hypothetical protein